MTTTNSCPLLSFINSFLCQALYTFVSSCLHANLILQMKKLRLKEANLLVQVHIVENKQMKVKLKSTDQQVSKIGILLK